MSSSLLAGTAGVWLCTTLVAATACIACSRGAEKVPRRAAESDTARHVTANVAVPAEATDTTPSVPARLSYAGRNGGGVPHYVHRSFTDRERTELRQVFGVEDPDRLYLTDSTDAGFLKYDESPDHGSHDMVYSYSLGFVSLRHLGESWSAFRRRIQAMSSFDFPASARTADRSLDRLDPSVRPLFENMVAAARTAGFPLEIVETYRTPEREAFLLSRSDGRTYTATSLHSYGRAVDVQIGNGDASNPRTRRRYVAFRRWALRFGRGRLRLIGAPAQTWDWNHVEAPAAWLGYHSITALLAAAHRCAAATTPAACTFAPRRSAHSP